MRDNIRDHAFIYRASLLYRKYRTLSYKTLLGRLLSLYPIVRDILISELYLIATIIYSRSISLLNIRNETIIYNKLLKEYKRRK
ncbi:hypothetical protein N7530_010025 [Penicillium desertorum]|uniref:Uncharacterized protein n=1 Tax=Penicillium desertorum TaxID=1303715 RepID=A0A9W9WJI9_9EURO|nr:hypothetical protein N7530_010025 [Penicillium desertorum]